MNVFELAATLTLDTSQYDSGLKKSGVAGSNFATKFGDGLKSAAKIGTAAIGAASAAVGALVKKSVDAYANYEQLVGGVETLYGAQGMSLEEYAKSVGKSVDKVRGKFDSLQSAQNKVMKNAANAYKTAGLSANEYMETITSFAASLTSSLGGDTEKSADYADMAIRDMADNANKMGTSIGSIQTAYQGFAKQNYSMLDNLKLGYGGTSSEMYRLLKDAAALNKEFASTAKFSIDEKGHLSAGYADIVKAINIVQSEMGITGTTAKEASETISGSISSAKAAWQNLLVGFSDGNADIGKLIDELISSITTAAGNLVPTIQNALVGIATAFDQLVPIISDKLPSLFQNIVPPLLSAAAGLFSGLINALPSLIQAVVSQIPSIVSVLLKKINLSDILKSLVQLVVNLGSQLAEMATTLIPEMVNAIFSIINSAFSNVDQLVEVALTLLNGIIDGVLNAIPILVEKLPEIYKKIYGALLEALPVLIDGIVQLVEKIVIELPTIIKALISALPSIIQTVINTVFEALPQLIQGLVQLVILLVENLPTIILALIEAIPTIIEAIIDGFVNNIDKLVEGAIMLVIELVKHLPEIIWGLIKAIPKIVMSIVNAFLRLGGKFLEIGVNLVKGIWDGIVSMGQWLWDQISGFFGGIVNNIKNFFGIHSPSKLFRDQIGKNLALGIGEGFVDTMSGVAKDMEGAIPTDFDAAMQSTLSSNIVPAKPQTNEQSNGTNFYFEINNPQIRNDEDIEKLADKVSETLGRTFRQRSVAYG